MAGNRPNDPRDAYTLFVWPDKGPLVGVKLDMVRVRAASATDTSGGAAADEVIRQLAQDPRLRGVDLRRNRELLVNIMRFWIGRIVRVDGMVYPAPGATPDPVAEMNRRIHEIEEAWRAKLERQKQELERQFQASLRQRDETHTRANTALDAQYKALLTDAFDQRNSAMDLLAQAQAEVGAAHARASFAERASAASGAASGAASEETIAAQERAQVFEERARALEAQVRSLNGQLADAANANNELEKLRDELARREQARRGAEREVERPPVVEPADGSHDADEPRPNRSML